MYSESESEDDDDDGQSKRPRFAHSKIRHMGTVNRIRVSINIAIWCNIPGNDYN
jgi:hypothetical protein